MVRFFRWAALGVVMHGCAESAPTVAAPPPPPKVVRPKAAAEAPPPLAAAGIAGELDGLAQELGAPGGSIERPEALAGFFTAVAAGIPESASEKVHVVVLGNSLIATDGAIGIVRKRLIERLGDGGRGLLLADRLGPWGPRTRTGHAAGRWHLSTIGLLKPLTSPHGLTGAQHTALTAGASSRFDLDGETHAEILWAGFTPDATLAIEIDDARLSTHPALPDGQVQRTTVTLPEATHALKLVFDAPGPIVQGVVLERSGRGVVLDTLGIPSVDASLWLLADEALFLEQLRARTPALVMIMLGGNEVKRLAWKRSDLERQERDLHTLIQRIRAATPNASCLVVSPIDSVRGPSKKVPFAQRPELEGYLEVQRRVALDEKCAYFDLFAAMGGSGSLKKFYQRGLIHNDLVHPRGQGLDLLGELLASALLRAYDAARPPP